MPLQVKQRGSRRMVKKPGKGGVKRPKSNGLPTPMGAAVGKRIRSRREEIGLTQEQLGGRLSEHRSKGMISQWEKGTTTPTLEQLVEIARELHTDQTWIAFGGTKDTIPISGNITSGGIVVAAAQLGDTARVAVPPTLMAEGIDLTAWRVMTDGIPSLHNQDLIFAASHPTEDFAKAVGHDAIVELENGTSVFRRIEWSDKPACVSLVDHRGAIRVDIAPVRVWIVLSIVKASAVEQIKASRGRGASR